MIAESHVTSEVLQKILNAGEDLISRASSIIQKSAFDSTIDIELRKYLQEASLIRIQLESEDHSDDEENIAVRERLPSLDTQMNTVWNLLHASASIKSKSTSLLPLAVFLGEILKTPVDAETTRVFEAQQILHCCKNHPLYASVQRYLQSDATNTTRVLEEIYYPFFHICHSVRDLHILQNDFGSLVKLQGMVTNLCGHLSTYRNAFRKHDSPMVHKKPKYEPSKTQDEITKELDDLFEAVPETVTPRLSGSTVVSLGEPVEESNLLPFHRGIALFSQLSWAIFLKSAEDTGAADQRRQLLSCFLTHMLQDDFRATFVMLLCDRLLMMCQLVDAEPSSQKLEELPSHFFHTNSHVKTSRLKSCATALMDTLRAEFQTVSSTPASNPSGLGNLDAAAKQKREQQLFGEAPTEMASLSSFSLADATRSPYFSLVREFDEMDHQPMLKAEEPVAEPLPEIPEPATLIEALDQPPLFCTEEEQNAAGTGTKGPAPLIIPPWSFYATLKQRKDQIYAQILKEQNG